jgi:surface antigen
VIRKIEKESDMSLKKIGCAVALAGLLTVSATGCAWVEEQTGFGQKTQIGAVGGATAGGLLAAVAGASPVGLAAGVILGGLAGGAVGNYLDSRDKEAALQAQQQSLTSNKAGETTSWSNPDSGNTGSYTPTNTYTSKDGKICRDYQQTVTINGKQETATGTACKMSDGTWRVHNA